MKTKFGSKGYRKMMSEKGKNKGYGKWMKGRKLPLETRLKMKKRMLENPLKFWEGKKLTEEHKKHISLGVKKRNLKHTVEFKQKQSKRMKSDNPMENPNTREKVSESLRGSKSPNWKGGISFEPYSIDWTETLRRSIKERDHYLCKVCNQYGNSIHHIDYNKKNCNPNNLITLCKKCHGKTDRNRNYWMRFLKKIAGRIQTHGI